MFVKILKKDFFNKKRITVVMFLFLLFSTALVAGGAYVITTLARSIGGFMESAKTPDYVQMHTGAADEGELEEFSRNQPLVEHYQLVKMLNIDGERSNSNCSDEKLRFTDGKIRIPRNIHILEKDMIRLLGNLLDNATEGLKLKFFCGTPPVSNAGGVPISFS